MKLVIWWSVVLAAGVFMIIGFGAAVLAHHPSVTVWCEERIMSPGEACQEADANGQPHLYSYEQMKARWAAKQPQPPWTPLVIGGVLTPVGAVGMVWSIRRRRAAINAAAQQSAQPHWPPQQWPQQQYQQPHPQQYQQPPRNFGPPGS